MKPGGHRKSVTPYWALHISLILINISRYSEGVTRGNGNRNKLLSN